MIDPAVLDAMLAAGASAEVIVAAVKADQAKDEVRLAAKRANNAERQQRFRDARNASNALRDVTCVTSPAPLVPPLPLPPDPQPLPPFNPPTPAISVRAKSSGFAAPEGVTAEAWEGFCKQRKKRMTQIAFDGIVERLAEHTNDLWPPDRLVRRAIECGHETIWPAPREQTNGTHQPNHGPNVSGKRASPALALLREAEFQERAERDQAFGGGTGFALQALGSG